MMYSSSFLIIIIIFAVSKISVIANGDTAELEDGNKTVILEADLKKNEPDLGKGKGLSSDQALELAKNVLNIVMQVGCENLKKFARIPRTLEETVEKVAAKFFSELVMIVCNHVAVKEPNKNETTANYNIHIYSANITVYNTN